MDDPLPGWPYWTSWSWSSNGDPYQTLVLQNSTEEYLCGNSSLEVGIQNGGLALGYSGYPTGKPPIPVFTVNTTLYTYFQFWVIPQSQYQSVVLTVSFDDGTNSYGPVVCDDDYVLNYLIENIGWTRVKIPLSLFGFPNKVQTIQTFTIRQNGYQNDYVQLYFDEIMFTNGKDGAGMTAGFNASNLALYEPGECKVLVGDGAAGESAGSALENWFKYL